MYQRGRRGVMRRSAVGGSFAVACPVLLVILVFATTGYLLVFHGGSPPPSHKMSSASAGSIVHSPAARLPQAARMMNMQPFHEPSSLLSTLLSTTHIAEKKPQEEPIWENNEDDAEMSQQYIFEAAAAAFDAETFQQQSSISSNAAEAVGATCPYSLPSPSSSSSGASAPEALTYDFSDAADGGARVVERIAQRNSGGNIFAEMLYRKISIWSGHEPSSSGGSGKPHSRGGTARSNAKKTSEELQHPVNVRVLCYSYANGVKSVLDQVEIWIAQQCQHFIFFTASPLSPQETTRLKEIYKVAAALQPATHYLGRYEVVVTKPAGGDSQANGWARFMAAVQYIANEWEHMSEIDWFFAVGPTTLVLYENLCRYLSSREMMRLSNVLRVPLVVGHRMTAAHNNMAFVSGSAFLMNQEATKIVANMFNVRACSPDDINGPQDLLLGACLSTLGVAPMHAVDEHAEDLITIFPPEHWLSVVRNPQSLPWYQQYRQPRPMPYGLAAMSEFPFAMLYSNSDEGRLLRNRMYEQAKKKK